MKNLIRIIEKMQFLEVMHQNQKRKPYGLFLALSLCIFKSSNWFLAIVQKRIMVGNLFMARKKFTMKEKTTLLLAVTRLKTAKKLIKGTTSILFYLLNTDYLRNQKKVAFIFQYRLNWTNV